jgi:cytoskeletal protein CcmA (bactofilin family)
MAYNRSLIKISPKTFPDQFRSSVNRENGKILDELVLIDSSKLSTTNLNSSIDNKLSVVGVASTIIPTSTSVSDLGSSTKKFRALNLSSNITAAGTLNTFGTVEISGNTIRSTDTTLLTINDNLTVQGAVNATSVVSSGSVSGTTGVFSGAVSGTSFTGAVSGAVTGNVTGNVLGNLTGNVTGNVQGNLTGNVNATTVTTSTAIVGGSNIRSFAVAMGVALS